MAEMQVELVAVERQIWSGPAQMVVARTVEGDIGVMPGHAPLLAQLRDRAGDAVPCRPHHRGEIPCPGEARGRPPRRST